MKAAIDVPRIVPILAVAVVLVFLAQPAAAATYTWDANTGQSGAQDGSGTWSTGASYNNWWTGSQDVAWPTSGGTCTAVFGTGGTAGTVTVSGAGVAVGAMTFSASVVGAYTISGGSLALGAAATTITTDADATIGAILSGSGGLTNAGTGTLTLTASNNYSGATTVSGGILQLSNTAALPSGSNLTLDGGAIELNAGDFTRNAGTAAGQVQFTSNGGGFAAVGANRIVNIGNSATLTWGGSGSFLPDQAPLMLGTPWADSTVDFQNPIQVAGTGPQIVQVTAGSGTAAVAAQLSGVLSGSGGLTIYGGGTLELTASNTYTGPTTVYFATLRLSNTASLPGGTAATATGSNLTLDGGVIELNAGDFTRSAGTAAGQVQFTANGGGFSAVGANRIVNLSNSATLTWGGSGSFLPDQAPLMLGTPWADSTVDFQNPIQLAGSGPQTVQVTAGSGTAAVAAQLSGILSGSGGLIVYGGGTLELTASNTYTGPTTVSFATLRLSNTGALPGGNLTLDGGVIELNAGDFTRSSGTAAGQVQFTSNGGGFAAVGANRIVNIGNSATLTWGGSGNFLPDQALLMLGSPASDSTLDFQNPIQILAGSGPQTVQVTAGSGTAAVNAQLSGVLSGSGGLTVTGGGLLELTASNTYTGPTTVSFATLRLSNSGALPGGSNLTLDGGVIELAAANFTATVGSGSGQVQFTSNGGGFSAVGANRVVNLGNLATLTWGTVSFLPNGAPLMLSTAAADATVDFQNPLNLGSGTQTVEVASGLAPVDAQLSGVLSGSGGLIVNGGGTLELTASNTYTGSTTVSGGILRLSNAGALPGGTGATSTGSNLTLDGGVIELNAGDFTRNLGTGPGQVQFTSSGGGFSAVGANRIVNLGNSAALTWGSGSFLPSGAPLMLGTPSADSTIDFQNPINLGNGVQTVQVAAGSGTAAVNARLSGVLSGSGGLTMIGYGTLELTASNTYTGPTTVSGIILRLSNSGALPGGSNLTLDGGVIELAAGDFTCNLGTGPGQVQFTSNGGGFSAVGANRIVNLGNSAQLTWGSGSFLPNGAPLMLGTPSDDSTVDFQNPINLGSGPQTVLVASGLAAVDAELSGILSGSGGLTMAGNGTLVLSGTNNTYTGGTVVEGGILVLESNGALADGSSLTIGAGAASIFAAAAAAPAASLTASPVPEPGTLALLFTALASLPWRKAWKRPPRTSPVGRWASISARAISTVARPRRGISRRMPPALT